MNTDFRIVLTAGYLFVIGACAAQQKEITASGKILDAISGKGIKARIFYKSYPTGSITGRFNDSTYSFGIFGSSKYFITAETDGYIQGTALIDPKEIGTEGKIVKDILLTRTGQTIVLEHLIFEQGKAVINPQSFPALDELTAMMKTNTRLVIQLEGHTDNQGDAKKNMELSQQRVDNVKKYLVSHGVEKDRVKTKAFGGTKPLQNSNTPDARARNRRVEMRILNN